MVEKEYISKMDINRQYFEYNTIKVRKYLEEKTPVDHRGIEPVTTKAHYKNCDIKMETKYWEGENAIITKLEVIPRGGNDKKVFEELEKILLEDKRKKEKLPQTKNNLVNRKY
jgi:hypothetical protein